MRMFNQLEPCARCKIEPDLCEQVGHYDHDGNAYGVYYIVGCPSCDNYTDGHDYPEGAVSDWDAINYYEGDDEEGSDYVTL